MLQVSPMLKKVNELMQYISNFDGRPDHESPTQLWITICFWVVLYMSIMWLAYWMLKAPWSGMKEKAMPQHTMRWLGCGMQHFTHLKSGENTIITRQMVQTDNAACWPAGGWLSKSQFQNVWEFWTIVSFSSLPHRRVYHILYFAASIWWCHNPPVWPWGMLYVPWIAMACTIFINIARTSKKIKNHAA